MSVALIAKREGLSQEYAARLMAPLKRAGLVSVTRGAGGGYHLVRSANEISVWEAILALGGPFFPKDFCQCHPGQRRRCVRSTDCSIRSLWQRADEILRALFESISLADLQRTESKMVVWLDQVERANA